MFQKTLFCDANKAKGLFRPISGLYLIRGNYFKMGVGVSHA